MAGMTLLDPPLLGEDISSGLPIQILAMDMVGDSCVFLTVDMDGLIQVQVHKAVKLDWRYSLEKRRWYSASLGVDAVLRAVEDDDDG